jgi:predicted dehydrogenase
VTPLRVGVVGCGFVADYYLQTASDHPEFTIAGVMDRHAARAEQVSAYYRLPRYRSLDELLRDPGVDIVLNLTNPGSHFEVSRAALEAGKHVYSEKPLATNLDQAEELVALAESRGLHLSGAPCNVLSETAQTMWKAVRTGAIGTVRLAYAELDDGLIHRMRYKKWVSDSGAPWPYRDEFAVGCTLEHAGYYVTWLVAMFGPAAQVTAHASTLIPDKLTDEPAAPTAPDFSVGCIAFANGVVARLTCSIVAPHNHRLSIFGDEGVLSTDECWNYTAPVYLWQRTPLRLWAEKYSISRVLPWLGPRKYPLLDAPPRRHRYKGSHNMDFARGVADVAAAISGGGRPRLSAGFALHVNEIVLAIQAGQGTTRLRTTCAPMAVMPWAAD